MALALFDLDNTLLSGDSDFEWGQFLVEKNLVDAKAYEQANQKFYQQYKQGTLDIHEFSAFSFRFLANHDMETLNSLHQQFMQKKIIPLMGDKAKALVEEHKQRNDTLIIITATNSFITRPIANAFGIKHLIATEPEIINGKFTTKINGIPCFQEGKVTRLAQWLNKHKETMRGSVFYSDSHNDMPLLEIADTPVAVDPDEKLNEIAKQRNWKILSLR
jgi:HAD superfamily hydrolase (TIGR01490 family)